MISTSEEASTKPVEELEIPKKPADPGAILGRVWKLQQAAAIRKELAEAQRLELHGPKIPKLSARSAPRYIAAVAQAVKLKQLDAKQANAMLYAAQLLIAASRLEAPPKPSRARKPPDRHQVIDG